MATERRGGTMSAAALPPDFILPDPPRIVDMMRDDQLTRAKSALKIHFGERGDVLASGAGYLRQDPMNESERFAPNIVVAFGVKPRAIIARNGYIISEVGKPPDFVAEVATRFSATPDFADKREGYRRYGVGEYWRFDETGGARNGVPLAGDALADGEYVPSEIIQDEDGRYWGYSEVLELYLCWDDGILRFFDHKSDGFLPDQLETKREGNEAKRERDAAMVERNVARVERDTAIAERDEAIGERDEATGERDAAIAERDAATAENERLRARLRDAGIEEEE